MQREIQGQLEQGWRERGQAWVCGQQRAAELRAGSPSVWARLFTGKKVAHVVHSDQQSKAGTMSSSQHTHRDAWTHTETQTHTEKHMDTHRHTHREHRHRHTPTHTKIYTDT